MEAKTKPRFIVDCVRGEIFVVDTKTNQCYGPFETHEHAKQNADMRNGKR